MGEAINLVENFKVEKVIFNCGVFNDLEQELIKELDKKKIKYYSCIKKLNIDVTEELNKKIKELLETKVLNRRILKAYPKYRINIIKKYSKTKHEKLKDKIEKVKDKLKNS